MFNILHAYLGPSHAVKQARLLYSQHNYIHKQSHLVIHSSQAD